MLADSPEAQIVAQLAPIDGEPVIDKGCVDPFVGTPLREVLAAEGIDRGGARRRRHQPRRRVRGPARQRRRPAGDRRRGHVRVLPPGLPRVLGAEHAAAVRHRHHVRRACSEPCHDRHDVRRRGRRRRGGRPVRRLCRRRGRRPGRASWSGPPRPRPAATPATPRRSCGCSRSTRPPTGSRTPWSTTSWATPTRRLMADAALTRPSAAAPLYRAHHVVDPDYVAELAASAPETLAWMGAPRDALRLPAHPVPHHVHHPDGAGRRRSGDRGDDGQGRPRARASSSTSRPPRARWSPATPGSRGSSRDTPPGRSSSAAGSSWPPVATRATPS